MVHQSNGERNFHIFYQLLRGGEPELLQQLHLKNNLDNYYYITDGVSIIYKNNWKVNIFDIGKYGQNA